MKYDVKPGDPILRIMEVRRKRALLRTEGLAYIGKLEVEKRKGTEDEEARYESIKNENDQLFELEGRYLDMAGIKAEDLKNVNAFAQDVIKPEDRVATTPAAGRSYRSMFYGDNKRTLENGGFKSLNEFLTAIDSGGRDERLQTRTMVEGTPSAGGFAVPEEFSAFLLDSSLESEIVRPRAQVWGMTSETKKIPAWDNSDHSSNLFGGLSLVWLGENSTASRQSAKVRQILLTARKAGIYANASRELAADGVDFENQLTAAMIKSMSFGLDYAYINGDGAGKPLGILKDPALVTVTAETNQASSTIIYENVLKMFARLHPSCVKNAVWLANQTAIPQLSTMSIAVGTGGAPVMAVQNGQMLTRPLIYTEKLPALGTLGDLVLVDFSQYAIGMRQELVLDKSNAPGWTEDTLDYRVILRTEGMGTWSKAVTPKNGDTLSWVVTLGAR